jgi:hypothetical protein
MRGRILLLHEECGNSLYVNLVRLPTAPCVERMSVSKLENFPIDRLTRVPTTPPGNARREESARNGWPRSAEADANEPDRPRAFGRPAALSGSPRGQRKSTCLSKSRRFTDLVRHGSQIQRTNRSECCVWSSPSVLGAKRGWRLRSTPPNQPSNERSCSPFSANRHSH